MLLIARLYFHLARAAETERVIRLRHLDMSKENQLEEQYINVKYDNSSDIEEWTAKEEKTLVTKLDLRIVPLVTVLYLLCFIDRYKHLKSNSETLRPPPENHSSS